jgi:predicted phage baseplate assembly protein
LGFDSDLPFPSDDIDLLVNIYSDSSSPFSVEPCDPELLFLPVPVTLVFEFYDGQRWRFLDIIEDETRAMTRSGHIRFEGPGTRLLKTTFPGAPAAPLYWVRARLSDGSYQQPPRLEKVLTNSVSATQAITVTEEVLGGSDGSPSQKFTLDNNPVIAREQRDTDGSTIVVSTLELVVDEGDNTPNQPQQTGSDQPGGAQPTEILWTEVKDFLGSDRNSRHYTLDRGTGEILFGDGEYGLIPPFNAQNAAGNIIARSYQYGGGRSGNLPANQITELQSAVDFVDSVTNLRPAIGGADEESLDDAKARAKQVVQNRNRAVTSGDFEVMARRTPGVNIRRAHAMPLSHPRFPKVAVPGVVTVVIIPDTEDQRPTPTEDTINRVCAYLSKNRLLTTEVYVTPANYRKVTIEATVIAKPQADLGGVKQDVEQRLATYFHPFKGGEDGSGWGFGQDIVYSDIFRQILNNPLVDRIEGKLAVYLDDVKQPDYQDVSIDENDLLYTDGHKIDVRYRSRS